jgi:hypothetical protein
MSADTRSALGESLRYPLASVAGDPAVPVLGSGVRIAVASPPRSSSTGQVNDASFPGPASILKKPAWMPWRSPLAPSTTNDEIWWGSVNAQASPDVANTPRPVRSRPAADVRNNTGWSDILPPAVSLPLG